MAYFDINTAEVHNELNGGGDQDGGNSRIRFKKRGKQTKRKGK